MVIALALAAAAAIVQPSPMKHVVVAYRDLDLSQPEGARVLNDRVADAAEQICAPSKSDADFALPHELKACRDEVITRAHALVRAVVTQARSSRTAYSEAGRRP